MLDHASGADPQYEASSPDELALAEMAKSMGAVFWERRGPGAITIQLRGRVAQVVLSSLFSVESLSSCQSTSLDADMQKPHGRSHLCLTVEKFKQTRIQHGAKERYALALFCGSCADMRIVEDLHRLAIRRREALAPGRRPLRRCP